jgi:hypothetical protein
MSAVRASTAMAARSPLRRWKRLFPTFSTIDAAIMASVQAGDDAQSAMVLRRATVDVVQDLCDAPEDDAAKDLCGLLDEVMVEYLITLKAVTVTPTALASTGLVRALGAIEDKHESKRVRELARFVRLSVCKASDQKLAPKCRASDDREKKN